MTLATVVIPCFNHAHFLAQAIASAARQDSGSVEIIVVDDGSTDDTAAVAAAHGATVIRQNNRGLGAARNAGLRAAAGEYIVFLDADDELMPDAVSSGVAMLSAHRRADCVVRRCQLVDEGGAPLPTQHAEIDPAHLYTEWLRRNFVWTPGAAMFRTAAIRRLQGFPEDVGPAADYAVYLQLARANRVLYDPRNVVMYRQHASNMSRDAPRMLTATLEVLRRERNRLPPQYIDDYRGGLRGWRMFYGEQIVQDLRGAWRTRRFGRADRRRLWLLIRECPETLRRHVWKKLVRMAQGLPRAPLEPGRYAQPALRRPGDAGR